MNRRDLFNRLLGPAHAAAASSSTGELLVVIFLRGGCDALSLLPPVAVEDRKIYDEERPTIRVPANLVLGLDDRNGLHPSASRLHELYKEKKLAVFVGAGMKSNNRSHFDAQAFIELGTPDRKSTTSGWLARHLDSNAARASDPMCAIALGSIAPASLLGSANATSVLQPRRFSLLGGEKDLQDDIVRTMKSMYFGAGPVAEKARSAISVIELLGQATFTDSTNSVEYPKGELANHLKTLAQLVKMQAGIQVATVDMGGWDTHKYHGQGVDGTFAKQVEQLSTAVHAFHKDLEADAFTVGRKPTIVIMSEFGRRLRENANRGTDHGHGGMMLVLGAEVKGGKVYGQWPGLKTDQLYERADLAVSTDFRQVLSEILVRRRKERSLAKVFPEFHADKDLDFLRPA